MKINLITRKNKVGQLRLLFSYHCKSRRFFATGVIIPLEDYEPGRLERPVRKTSSKAEHYNKIQQIISTIRREGKLSTADLVYLIHQNKKRIESADKKRLMRFSNFLKRKNF